MILDQNNVYYKFCNFWINLLKTKNKIAKTFSQQKSKDLK